MVSFSILLLISASTITGVLSVPQKSALSTRQTLISPSSGTNNGYYYEYWSNSNSQEVTLGSGGSYSVNWSGNSQPFLVGKGWNPGSAQTISYTGSFTPNGGTAFLSVYGWTTSPGPLIEYRIVESYSAFEPSTDVTFEYKGNLTSDGGIYNMYFISLPDEGFFPNETFRMYWSVRTDKRVGGTVTTANHFDAWKAAGMELGTFNYQIVATEGDGGGDSQLFQNDRGSGFSSITIL